MRARYQRLPPAIAVYFTSFLVYLLLSLLVYGRHARWGAFLLTNAGADVWSSVWFLNWWPWAIAHGHGPLLSTYVYAPEGYDLSWATSTPTAALLALPVTLTLGAATAFNVLSVSAPALNAVCALLLVRRSVGASLPVCVACGLLFGFSPYEAGQLRGHLNLDLNFPIPLACLLMVERARGRLSARAFIPCLALVLLTEFGLSTEVFATLVSLGALVWVLFALMLAGRGDLLRAGAEAVVALLLVAVIASPWLLHMALNASSFPEFVNPPWMYSTNLENLVVPTRLTAFGGNLLSAVSARFSGNLSEQGGYVGVPLLSVAVLLAWERRRDRAVAALSLATLGLVVASLGPSLHVATWDSHVPLPWWIALHLPLLKGVMPARFSMYVALCTALIAAAWQSGATSPAGRRTRLLVLLGACVSLCPNPAQVVWSRAPLLPFFDPAHIRSAVTPDANVLILPYLTSEAGATPAMLWQWQAGMSFRQAGGYLNFVPLPASRSQFVQHLMRNEPSTWFSNDLSAFAAATGIAAVLAGPGTAASLTTALRGTGWHEERADGIDLFSVPPRSDLHYARLSGEVWYAFDRWSWMGSSAEVSTHAQPAILHLSATVLPTPGSTITVRSGSSTRSYRLASPGTLDVRLPPDGVFSITPGATIVPARVLPDNHDERSLSYLVSIEPVEK